MPISIFKIKKWAKKGKVGSTPLVFLLLSVLVLNHGCSLDEKAFEKAKAENTEKAYRDYLKKTEKFTHRKYEEEARYRIAELSGKETNYSRYLSGFTKGKYADDATWWMARNLNTRQDYEKYLKKYPNGKHAKEAQSIVEKMEFKRVSDMDTIKAYEDFISSYPKGELRKDAESRLESMLNQRHPLLKDAKTIKLVLEESLPGEATLQSEFENVVKILTDLAGIRLLDSEAEKADLELYIQIKGGAKAAQYNIGKRYTGAWLKGTILLKRNGTVLHKRYFSGSVEPYRSHLFFGSKPAAISLPQDAPFSEVFDDDFLPLFIDLMIDYFGRHILHPIARGYRTRGFGIGKGTKLGALWGIEKAVARMIFALWKSGDSWADKLLLDCFRGWPSEGIGMRVDMIASDSPKDYHKWELWIADLKERIEAEKKQK